MVKEFGLPWIAHLLLQFFIGFIWGAVIRLVRGRLLWAIIYLITGGFIGIGWIYTSLCSLSTATINLPN